MKIWLILILIFSSIQLSAKEIVADTLAPNHKNIPVKVDQPPIFKSDSCIGLEAEELASCSERQILKFIYQNLRYPPHGPCVEGLIVAAIIIGKDGKVIDASILRSIGAGTDEEVLKVVRQLEFYPAEHNGKLTEVKYHIPVRFRLSQN